MTLVLIPSKFPDKWGKLDFLFYQCAEDINEKNDLTLLSLQGEENGRSVFKHVTVKKRSHTTVPLRRGKRTKRVQARSGIKTISRYSPFKARRTDEACSSTRQSWRWCTCTTRWTRSTSGTDGWSPGRTTRPSDTSGKYISYFTVKKG